ncbi:hypothetical protein [Streptomyces bacillaris]|uniref:hypothetical protein n=1 Tax=Streptomyces bacillaris TaxID=68179 RepID=UPI0038076981
MTKTLATATPTIAVRFAAGAVLGFTPGANYYTVIVRIDDAHQRCPVLGWATVLEGYDDNGDARTRIELTLLVGQQVLTQTQFLAAHGPDSIVELQG